MSSKNALTGAIASALGPRGIDYQGLMQSSLAPNFYERPPMAREAEAPAGMDKCPDCGHSAITERLRSWKPEVGWRDVVQLRCLRAAPRRKYGQELPPGTCRKVIVVQETPATVNGSPEPGYETPPLGYETTPSGNKTAPAALSVPSALDFGEQLGERVLPAAVNVVQAIGDTVQALAEAAEGPPTPEEATRTAPTTSGEPTAPPVSTRRRKTKYSAEVLHRIQTAVLDGGKAVDEISNAEGIAPLAIRAIVHAERKRRTSAAAAPSPAAVPAPPAARKRRNTRGKLIPDAVKNRLLRMVLKDGMSVDSAAELTGAHLRAARSVVDHARRRLSVQQTGPTIGDACRAVIEPVRKPYPETQGPEVSREKPRGFGEAVDAFLACVDLRSYFRQPPEVRSALETLAGVGERA